MGSPVAVHDPVDEREERLLSLRELLRHSSARVLDGHRLAEKARQLPRVAGEDAEVVERCQLDSTNAYTTKRAGRAPVATGRVPLDDTATESLRPPRCARHPPRP